MEFIIKSCLERLRGVEAKVPGRWRATTLDEIEVEPRPPPQQDIGNDARPSAFLVAAPFGAADARGYIQRAMRRRVSATGAPRSSDGAGIGAILPFWHGAAKRPALSRIGR